MHCPQQPLQHGRDSLILQPRAVTGAYAGVVMEKQCSPTPLLPRVGGPRGQLLLCTVDSGACGEHPASHPLTLPLTYPLLAGLPHVLQLLVLVLQLLLVDLLHPLYLQLQPLVELKDPETHQWLHPPAEGRGWCWFGLDMPMGATLPPPGDQQQPFAAPALSSAQQRWPPGPRAAS